MFRVTPYTFPPWPIGMLLSKIISTVVQSVAASSCSMSQFWEVTRSTAVLSINGTMSMNKETKVNGHTQGKLRGRVCYNACLVLFLKLALTVINKTILDRSNKLLHFKISFTINFTTQASIELQLHYLVEQYRAKCKLTIFTKFFISVLATVCCKMF